MTGSHEIAALSFWRRVWTSSSGSLDSRPMLYILGINFALQIANVFLRTVVGRSWSLAITVGIVVLMFAIFVVISHRRNPPPVIDFDEGVLRIGPEATPFAEVDEAAVAYNGMKGHDDLHLWFGGHRRRHAMVVLRGSRDALSAKDRTVLAAMVERSGIQLPAPKVDPYDPKGKFAWLDQRGYATKEQVLEAILHTPATGDVKRS